MPTAKSIKVSAIKSDIARNFVRKWHYSGKDYPKSRLHLGAFIDERLVGVMQFGDPLDRSNVIGLVRGTKWNDMLELNRMAMVDDTPKNTESRFISVAIKLIKRHYPNIEWLLSFSDGCQCGDGTIYRASGFVLTGIKKNTELLEYNGEIFTTVGIRTSELMRAKFSKMTGRTIISVRDMMESGAKKLTGYQFRYIYFINPSARDRLTVPVLPFSEIDKRGAGMYLGKSMRAKEQESGNHPDLGGATPTCTLHHSGQK